MAVDDLGNALCYHPLGSGRAGFASRRRLDLYQVLETGFTRARHEPAIGATTATRLVGLRRSLASKCPQKVSRPALARGGGHRTLLQLRLDRPSIVGYLGHKNIQHTVRYTEL